MSNVARYVLDHREAIGLDNGRVRVAVVPSLGGQIASLVRGGFDYIYPPEALGSDARCEMDGSTLVVSTERGVRRIALDGDDVLLDDTGVTTYPHLVSAPDCELVLPGSVITVDVEWSATERFSGVVTWPWASANNGDVVDLAHLDGAHLKVSERLWTSKLREGSACFVHPANGMSLAYAFDCVEIPHLRVTIDQGGSGRFCVCIEPRVAKTDIIPPGPRRVRLSPRGGS